MATLDINDANIVDAEETNWRVIVYPILAILVVAVAGFGYYYHQQSVRDALEADARVALLKAKSPEDLVKVADQFPNSDTGSMALLQAANDSFEKQDYAGAIQDCQRVADATGTAPMLRDSALLGLASAEEGSGKSGDATTTYLEVARRGDKTPYAPYAYSAAARLYDLNGDKENERKVLTEASGLDPDSAFVKQAKAKLEELNAAAVPPVPVVSQPFAAPSTTAPVVSAPVSVTNAPVLATKPSH